MTSKASAAPTASSPTRILVLTRQYGGLGYYRQRIPARILASYPDIQVTHFDGLLYNHALRPKKRKSGQEDWVTWLEEHIGNYDVVLFDRPTDFSTLAYLRGFVQNSPTCRLVVDFDDDFTQVPRGNPAYRDFRPGKEAYEAGLASLRTAEAVSVSTDHLTTITEPLTHFCRTLPNMIDFADWPQGPINPERAADPAVRILYSGASGHYADLDEVSEAVTKLINDPPTPLRLFVVGSAPVWLHDLARKFPSRVIVLPWHPFHDYPTSMAWGVFDFAIAPLTDCEFNYAKSDIKILEAGALGIPIVCSNIGPYRDPPLDAVFRTENTTEAWYEALKVVALDKDLRAKVGQTCYDWVKTCRTSATLGYLWYDFIQEVTTRPRIETLEDTRLPSDPVIEAP